MLEALREFTMVHAMSAARRQVAADLWTKLIGLNHKPACKLPVNYTHHRHFIITQPESWYSFDHLTEGRRLSRPSWLATYRDGLPARTRSPIQVLTGRRVTSLIETNALPLSHATNQLQTTNMTIQQLILEVVQGGHQGLVTCLLLLVSSQLPQWFQRPPTCHSDLPWTHSLV